jgi:hypothetical protein
MTYVAAFCLGIAFGSNVGLYFNEARHAQVLPDKTIVVESRNGFEYTFLPQPNGKYTRSDLLEEQRPETLKKYVEAEMENYDKGER